MRLDIRDIVTKNKLVILILLLAAFLRVYKLPEFTTFLSDQGRDAIIVRNIVTLKHWPAIGAPSSVGQVYLGPFYYYLIAPFLLLFNFNPAGLAFGAAFLSLIGIIAGYLVTREEVGKLTAVLFLVFTAFSFENIEQSRFSWNPNLLPFFAFFTLYFFYKLMKTDKIIFAILLGTFLSFSVQLHYLAVFLTLPMILIAVTDRKLIIKLGKYLVAIISFLFFSLPLVIFDLRHQFLNSKNFLTLFKGGLVSGSSLSTRFLETIQVFFSTVLTFKINSFVTLLILVFLAAGWFFLKKKDSNLWIKINLLNIVTFLLFFAFMNASRLPHYFGPIYLSLFLVTAYYIANAKLNRFFIILLVLLYVGINVPHYYFFYQKGNNQIAHSQKVGDFLATKINHQPFNIATWPVQLTEDNFVYFLELKGLVPANRQKAEITDQMFVLCDQEPCEILNSPSWNISMFGPAKIDNIWDVDGIKIYKLIHNK